MPMDTELITPDEVRDAARRVASHVERTPMLPCPWLTDEAGTEVFVKWESQQITGSFKLRGALYKMMRLRERGATAALAVSAGNHGLGIAHAARIVGMRATIVVPKSAAPTKVEALKRYDIELIIEGDDYDAAEAFARGLAEQRGIDFVSPYNDAQVIAGQATVAIEMLSQTEVDVVLVPVGGGGLAAGMALAMAWRRGSTAVVGVQAANARAMHEAFRAGEIVKVRDKATIADGLAGNLEEDSITVPIVRQRVRDILLVEEAAIERAIAGFVRYEHQIVEGSGAVGAAALLDGGGARFAKRRVGVVVTGRNLDPERLKKVLGRAVG